MTINGIDKLMDYMNISGTEFLDYLLTEGLSLGLHWQDVCHSPVIQEFGGVYIEGESRWKDLDWKKVLVTVAVNEGGLKDKDSDDWNVRWNNILKQLDTNYKEVEELVKKVEVYNLDFSSIRVDSERLKSFIFDENAHWVESDLYKEVVKVIGVQIYSAIEGKLRTLPHDVMRNNKLRVNEDKHWNLGVNVSGDLHDVVKTKLNRMFNSGDKLNSDTLDTLLNFYEKVVSAW